MSVTTRYDSGGILLVAPVPPPYGGMALQAGLLQRMLESDGVGAEVLGYNQPFALSFLDRIPALRTFLRAARFAVQCYSRGRYYRAIHILAASRLYFFLIVCPAVLIGRTLGKPVILNYRGGDADHFLRRYSRFLKPFFKMATNVTAPSEFLVGVIQRRIGVPVSVVPNIVNFSKFHYRNRGPFRPKMIVTRHLESLYGIDTVLRTFRQVQAWYPEASLCVAGTGSQESYLRSLMTEWGLKNVDFVGYVDHSRLPGLYDECDILLNGSRVDNFPASLLEASAAGLAVVSTNAGGIPFIYENGKNAILAEVDDSNALAAGVRRIVEDQMFARDLVSAALEQSRQFDWSNVRRALYARYGFSLPTPSGEAASALDPLASTGGLP